MAEDSDLEEQEENESTIEDLLNLEKQIIIGPQFQNPSLNGWSMVVIKDYHECSLVFPPINHENLHLKPSNFTEQLPKPCESLSPSLFSSSSSTLSTLSAENDDESNVSMSSPFSPMGSDQMVSAESTDLIAKQLTRPGIGVRNWLYYGLVVLLRKVKGLLCLFPSPSKAAFTAALVLAYLYFRRRSRVVIREERRDSFNRIIREKDEVSVKFHQFNLP